MNATRIVLVLALLAAGGAAYVSWQTANEKKELTENLATTTADRDDTKKKLTDKGKELDTALAGKKSSEEQVSKLSSELSSAKTSLATAESKASDAQKVAESEKTKAQAAEEEVKKLKDAYAGKTAEEFKAEIEKFKKEAEGLAGHNKELVDKLSSAGQQVAKYQAEAELTKRGTSAPGLNGKVVAVNTQWNFVVLDIGKSKGVIESSELTIVRGGKPIAKVKVAQVDDLTSVADLTKVFKDMRPNVGDVAISN